MSKRPLAEALLALGITILVSVPKDACAQTAQATQKPVFTTLHRFDDTHGASPSFTLTLGKDGNFYGVTKYGGSAGRGIIFKITPTGKFTTLVAFNGSNGAESEDRMVQGTDGAFYGTTRDCDAKNASSVYRVTMDGHFTRIHSFLLSDGVGSLDALMQGKDGNFYGTAQDNDFNQGMIYRMTPVGVVTVLHTFNGKDGSCPMGGLMQGPNGTLYGTTSTDGPSQGGTLFSLRPDGSNFTLLHAFEYNGVPGIDGNTPYSPPVMGSDGTLYGVTFFGGIQASGISYKVTPSGVYSVLYKFSDNGPGPSTRELTLGPDGALYGAAFDGGNQDFGTIFKLTLPQKSVSPPFISRPKLWPSPQRLQKPYVGLFPHDGHYPAPMAKSEPSCISPA